MAGAGLFREKTYCWLVASGWFVLRRKLLLLVADKPSEQGLNMLGLNSSYPRVCVH
jgi:hypothetical protein